MAKARKGKLESSPVPVSELADAIKHPLEYELLINIRDARLPKPEREYMFALKAMGRRWRADFCWPEHMVIAEVEGGTYSKGRHVRPLGFEKDCYKYNAATELGYALFRFTSKMVRNGDAIKQLKRILGEQNETEHRIEE